MDGDAIHRLSEAIIRLAQEILHPAATGQADIDWKRYCLLIDAAAADCESLACSETEALVIRRRGFCYFRQIAEAGKLLDSAIAGSA